MNIRVYDDPEILPNLTVWRDVEALERFVWQTLHKRMYNRRDEWFAPIEGAKLVLWWIPEGHRPPVAEGSNGSIISACTARATTLSAGTGCLPRNCGRPRSAYLKASAQHDQSHYRRQRNRRCAGDDAPAGMRSRGRGNPALLFPRPAVDCRQLPHVPDRSERRAAEAGGVLRAECSRSAPWPQRRTAGDVHAHADGEEGARRRDGIPADQPSRSIARSATRAASAICRIRRWPTASTPAASRRTSARSKTSTSARWSRPR